MSLRQQSPHGDGEDELATPPGSIATSPSTPRNSRPADLADWSQWKSLGLKLVDLPQDVTARNIWTWFAHHGTIVWIEVYPAKGKNGRTTAKMRFRPPPQTSFWDRRKYVIQVPRNQPHYNLSIPHQGTAISVGLMGPPAPEKIKNKHTSRSYPYRLTLSSESLGFGAMTEATSMKVLKTVSAMPSAPIRLEFDSSSKRFSAFFFIPGKNAAWRGLREYKFSIDVTQMKDVYRTELPKNKVGLVLSVARPPRYFWKVEDPSLSMQGNSMTWNIRDMYRRATVIAEDVEASLQHPVAIHTPTDDPHYIEIGRWTTFRFVLPNDTEEAQMAAQHLQYALEDFNIRFINCPVFEVSSESADDIWSYLNHARTTSSQGGALALLEHSMSRGIHLAFEVRYQLEVCISRGFLSEYTITLEFLERLEKMPPVRARLLLEYLADQDKTLYEPMRLLTDPEAGAYQPHLRIPSYCALVRKAIITPTTIRFSTANPETSNRVFRRYASLSDRFLRVQFVEESEQSKIFNKPENEALFRRIMRTLSHGIQIGDRNYEFLAFGSSQLRECGAYFFCPSDHTSCDDIRKWMGQFDHIKIVAKYAARIGQCFSTTREIRGIHMPDIHQMDDVERNGHCFTDGVGKISKFLAELINNEMDADVLSDPPAFQFRMGGCKGVLAVWPEARGKSVHIRDSQKKFESDYNGLEIIRCASYASATLNRQTITILEGLGVPTATFMALLDKQLEQYEKSMEDNAAAIDMLTQFVDENQTTLAIAELLRGDFKTNERQEPFVTNILKLWRTWSLKLLKEKARIHVEESAFVLGCVDETGSLRGHDSKTEGNRRREIDKLPQIFLQLSDPKSHKKTHIIEGICVVGRNPSLHPGDIRVVQAVNEPKLHHLKDVVVFPMTGDKPVPSMLSGGDLDGDDFFVIWNKHLIPMEWNHPPMDYVGTKPKEPTSDVTIDQIREFFVSYMKNDVLGVVAVAHLAHADELGPKHPTCEYG
jgi:RNA-dependent RNA polymerase